MSALMVVAHLAAAAAAAPLRLELSIAADKVSGAAPVILVLSQRTTAPITMSSVELNWADTQIHLKRLPEGPARVLTGADKVALGGATGRPTYPQLRAVAAGEAWTVRLPLYAYTRPLPPGRYRVCISHRYEGEGEGVARSNAVEFTVTP